MGAVEFRWRKFNGKEHWLHATEYLGTDSYGDWFLQREGQLSRRPNASYITETDLTILLPRARDWIARIFPSGRADGMKLYVDLAHDVHYDRSAGVVTAVDMDLDVIQLESGLLYLEDQDEFETHSVEMGYPSALVDSTAKSAERLMRAIAGGFEPFATVAQDWLNSKA